MTLLPGLAAGNTSLVVYFDAPEAGWSEATVSLFTDAERATVLHETAVPVGQVVVCRSPARYCLTLANTDGWGLVEGTRYVVRVTLTASDGSRRVSDFSGPAGPRVLAVPPSIPAEQVRGDLGAGSGGRRDSQPAVRGVGVNTATGAFTVHGVDAVMSSSFAVNVRAERSYSSDDTAAGLMGVGWSFGFDARVVPKPGSPETVVFRAEDGAETTYTKRPDGSYAAPAGAFSRLSAVAGGWELVTPGQQRLRFDTAGRLLSVRDKRGKGLALGYDGSGHLSTVTDAGGRVATVTVSGGRLARFGLPDGRTVAYTYAGDRLRTVREPDGAVTTYDYDPVGRLSKITDALGHVQLTNGYDPASGRVVSQADALGKVTRFAWDAGRQESKVTDPDGAVVFDGYLNNVLQYTQNGNGDTGVRRSDARGNTAVMGDPQGRQYESTHDDNGNTTSQTVVGAGAGPAEKATYDGSNNVRSFTDARGNTTTYVFNEFDQPLSVTDPLGNTTRFGYAPDTGLPLSVTDPLGHVTTLAYDAAGNRIAQTDPTGARTTYGYDATGRQVSVTDPRGNRAGANPAGFTATTAYDGEDRVRRATDPLGHFRLSDYDNAGRLRSVTDANSFQSVFEYDNADRLTVEHDPDLRTTSYEYTAAGRLRKVIDGVGDATSYSYNDAGRLKTVTSPRGNVKGANPADFTTTYDYDFNGNRTLASHPFPGGGTAVTQYRYDELNRLVAVTDPLGRTSTTTYDVAGNPVAATDPLGNTSTVGYDADNRAVSSTDPLGRVATTHYDPAGRVDFTVSPAGEKASFGYDPAGRQISRTSPRGNVAGADPAAFTTRSTFDPAGNLTAVTDPLGHTATAVYDAVNNLTRRADANGHATSYGYDAENRLTSIVGPDATSPSQATTNGYDHAGNLITRTNPRGFSSRYTYDLAGRLSSTIDELGRVREFGYDPDGNLVSTRTARATSSGDPSVRAANTITQSFDLLGRLVGRVLGDGPAFSYGYDAADQVVSLADRAGTQTRGYDPAGRLTGVSRSGSAFGYSYDAAGELTHRTLPDATAQTVTYDPDGRPVTLTGPAGTTAYSYDADSNPVRTVLPGGSATQRGYDNADRPTTLTALAPGGAVLAAYTMTRDPVGNVTRLDTTLAGTTHADAFSYDPADRLTAMCYQTTTCSGATQKLAFGYDLLGNRTSRKRTGTGGFAQTYSYDAANQLTATTGGPQGSVSYTYDADGNQTRAAGVTTSYDLDNKVATVDDGKQKTAYTTDAAGNRLTADTTGAVGRSSYQWDVNNPLPMLVAETAGNSPARAYTYHPDGSPLTLATGGGTFLYQPDPFGNTAELTDLAGTVLRQATLTDPFGEFTQTSPGGNSTPEPRLGFQGEYQDPLSGSYHLRARDYATGTGRFASIDPLTQSAGDPAQSPYAFGNNNPLSNSDPSGMGCGIFAKLCNTVSHAASEVKDAVVNTVSTVVQTTTEVIDKGVDLVKDTASDLKNAAGKVADNLTDTAKTVGHNIATGAKAAGHWVNEHKAMIAGIAAGIVVGALCEAVTVGAGSIGCAALAGAVGSMVDHAVSTPRNQWTLGGFAKAGAIGALTGALGGAAGKYLAKGVSAVAGKIAGRIGARAGSADGAAASAGRAAAADAAEDTAGGAAGRACSIVHSFDPDTQVVMADGTHKPIKNIELGDQVEATDPATATTTEAQPVTALHHNQDTDLTDLTIHTPDGTTDVLHTTQHHPFWDQTQQRWVDAADLTPGDQLHTPDGSTVTVADVHNFTGHHDMRDLTIANTHTYYVVAAGVPVLVHNCGEGRVVDQTLGAGPHAREGVGLVDGDIDAPGVRDLVNEAGNAHGCHVCGSRNPGTRSGNWVPDHQPPTTAVAPGTPQTAYPHCLPCARQQGGIVRQLNEGNYDFP